MFDLVVKWLTEPRSLCLVFIIIVYVCIPNVSPIMPPQVVQGSYGQLGL